VTRIFDVNVIVWYLSPSQYAALTAVLLWYLFGCLFLAGSCWCNDLKLVCCMKDKREEYHNCSVHCAVLFAAVYTVISTHIYLQLLQV